MRMLPVLLLSALASGTAAAAPVAPKLALTHYGMLLDGTDVPVNEMAQELKFRILDKNVQVNGEVEAWNSGTCIVPVRNGRYAVVLGETCGTGLTTAAIPGTEARFLEITVGTVALTPRLAIAMAPVAGIALDAAALGGKPASEFLTHADVLDAATLVGKTPEQLDSRWVKLQGDGATAQAGGLALSGGVSASSLAGDGLAITNLKASELIGALPAAVVTASNLVSTSGGALPAGVVAATNLVTTSNGALPDALLTASKLVRSTGDVTLGGTLTAPAISTPGALSAGASTLGAVTASSFTTSGTLAAGALTASSLTTGGLLSADSLTVARGGVFGAGVRMALDSTACSPANAGTIRWNKTIFEGCNGKGWVLFKTLEEAPSATSTIVTDNLIMNLDASNPASYGGTGTLWRDLTSNAYDMQVASGTAKFAAGAFDLQASTFNSTKNLPLPANNWTFEVQVQFPNYAEGSCWLKHGDNNTPNNSAHVCFRDNRKTEVDEYASRMPTHQQLVNGTKYTLTFVHEEDNLTSIYVNGQLDRTGARANAMLLPYGGATAPLHLTNAATVGSKLFKLRVYSAALTAPQVLQNYLATRD